MFGLRMSVRSRVYESDADSPQVHRGQAEEHQKAEGVGECHENDLAGNGGVDAGSLEQPRAVVTGDSK